MEGPRSTGPSQVRENECTALPNPTPVERPTSETCSPLADPVPDARMVAFRRGWDLYTVDVTSGKETRLTSDGSETLRNGIPD